MSEPIWDMVIADMKARDEFGRERYLGPLTVDSNGRDALQDAYEEALDMAVYLRQAIEQKKKHTEESDKVLRILGGDPEFDDLELVAKKAAERFVELKAEIARWREAVNELHHCEEGGDAALLDKAAAWRKIRENMQENPSC